MINKGRVGFWWITLSAVAIAAFAVLPYLTASLHELSTDGVGVAANYADRPGWVHVVFYTHVVAGGLALTISPLQFAAWVRARMPRLHRVSGRIAIVAMMTAGVAGLTLAPMNTAGPVGTAGFGMLAVLWMFFAIAAFRAARRRDFVVHRRWATRAFAMTYAAVMLRLWMTVLATVMIGVFGVDPDEAFTRAYSVVPFLCWVPNLLVVELLLRRQARAA